MFKESIGVELSQLSPSAHRERSGRIGFNKRWAQTTIRRLVGYALNDERKGVGLYVTTGQSYGTAVSYRPDTRRRCG